MALYRALSTLAYPRLRPGCVSLLAELPESTISILIEQGHVAVAQPPPLSLLTGFAVIAAKLKIDDVETFLRTGDADIAKSLRIKAGDIPALKQSVLEYLQTPKPDG